MSKERQSGLGKGLSALIPKKTSSELLQSSTYQINIEQIELNKYQPREEFNPQKLKELTDSIKEKGVIEPVVVTKTKNGYQLICGERRLRASKMLGLSKIPAVVRENVSNQEIIQISLIENIQREDLNVIEQAKSIKRLIDEFKLTQQDVSNVISKQRSSISHLLRLLTLPLEIQKRVKEGVISFGHAKVLLELETENSQKDICQRIVRYNLSVRETERLVKKASRFKPRSSKQKQKQKIEELQIREIEENLEEFLGSKVQILTHKKIGKIEIGFYSTKDLQRIIELIMSSSK